MKTYFFAILLGAPLFNGLTLRADDNTTYGPWTPVNGWPGLQYHVKRDYNSATDYQWWIQFENTYDKEITFDCGMGEAGTTPTLTDQLTVQAGSTGATWFVLKSHDSVAVVVGDEAFGGFGSNIANSQSQNSSASQQNIANQQSAIQAALQQQQAQLQQQQQAAQELQQQQAALQQQIAIKQAAFQEQQAALNAKRQQILNNYNAKIQNLQTIQNAGENMINAVGAVLEQQEQDKEEAEAKQEMEQQQDELEREQRESQQELDNLQAQLQEAQREASLTPEQRAEEEREREQQQAEAQRQAELQRQQQIEQQRQEAEEQRQEALRQQQEAERERQQMIAAIPHFVGTWKLVWPTSKPNGLKLWLTDSGTLAGSGEFKFKVDTSTNADATDSDKYDFKIDASTGMGDVASAINNGQAVVSFSGSQDHHYHRDHYFLSSDDLITTFCILCLSPIGVPFNFLMVNRTSSSFDGQLIFTPDGELYLGKDGQQIVELKKVNDTASAN